MTEVTCISHAGNLRNPSKKWDRYRFDVESSNLRNWRLDPDQSLLSWKSSYTIDVFSFFKFGLKSPLTVGISRRAPLSYKNFRKVSIEILFIVEVYSLCTACFLFSSILRRYWIFHLDAKSAAQISLMQDGRSSYFCILQPYFLRIPRYPFRIHYFSAFTHHGPFVRYVSRNENQQATRASWVASRGTVRLLDK